jgi:hypothetical protein
LTGIIRFAAFSAALIALLVFVVIPVVAGPIISGLVRDAGLVGDDVEVSVDLLGSGILGGRVPSVRLQADDLETAGADPVVLLPSPPSGSWWLRDVRISPDGMMLDLSVDLRDLAAQLIAPAT